MTRQFGLIGYPLGHSFSKGFFTAKFEAEGVDARYDNFPLEHISDFPALLAAHPQLEGINVTIPHKEKVTSYLHHVSPVVAAIGACNCIRIQNKQLTGYNTDVVGFEKSLRKKLGHHHNAALVLGTGGASKAVQYVLQQLQIPFTVISRKADPEKGIREYGALKKEDLQYATLWINTTPLGMAPNTESMPPLDYGQVSERHYLYDLVYNPAETKFLSAGKSKGAVIENGHDMLIIQAEESWAIWNA
ncbi:shikimate dehydrogenase family protein [Flavihumibacter fluvii]|uniref:shikimate dehydrogenase family protein n=1 Tax=Flavihumibacter fluvii TaxID=2838157 RepID=UPI001BDDE27C|nr:shikimate dehydrogenase [Flavihumibacter fluvii]ULQ54553.1 shikimate dehydrogenase [Flavihumibacter fluvii]